MTATRVHSIAPMPEADGGDFDWLVWAYGQMAYIRQFDLRLSRLVASSYDVARFIHLSSGQEAVAVGACAAAGAGDLMCLTYRGHGVLLARGADPTRMIREILACPDGYQRGIGGSMHLAAPDIGIIDAAAIVGGNLPVAVGAALKLRAVNESAAVFCFFGDGATATGSFHESLNVAAVLSLPVIFICENNRRSSRSVFETYSAVENVSQRALAYDIASYCVDGSDVTAVRDVVAEARRWTLGGAGPVLIEAEVSLLTGHFADAQSDIPKAHESDPLHRCRNQLATLLGGYGPSPISVVEQNVDRIVDAAFQEAGAR